VKPLTSSSASSERFLVCRGFQGCKTIATEVGDMMSTGVGREGGVGGEERMM